MPMCKRPKQENANVIKGPWKAKSKKDVVLPEHDVIEMQENIMFCDNLTEAVMVQLIHSVGENGFDVHGEKFLRDMGFIIEAVRASLYREVNCIHPMAKVMTAFTTGKIDEDDDSMTTSLNHEKLVKVLEDLDDEEEDPKDPA
jgi:hypothetical protein